MGTTDEMGSSSRPVYLKPKLQPGRLNSFNYKQGLKFSTTNAAVRETPKDLNHDLIIELRDEKEQNSMCKLPNRRLQNSILRRQSTFLTKDKLVPV